MPAPEKSHSLFLSSNFRKSCIFLLLRLMAAQAAVFAIYALVYHIADIHFAHNWQAFVVGGTGAVTGLIFMAAIQGRKK